MNKSYVSLLALLLVVISLSAAISFLVVRTSEPPRFNEPDELDEWLHKQLDITPAQVKAMKPSEDEFHRKEHEIVTELHALNEELARAMVVDKQNSEKIQEIVARIHSAQSRLQQHTIAHIFEMREHLEPEQYDKLLRHAADALTASKAPTH